jgi:hypothetical protein
MTPEKIRECNTLCNAPVIKCMAGSEAASAGVGPSQCCAGGEANNYCGQVIVPGQTPTKGLPANAPRFGLSPDKLVKGQNGLLNPWGKPDATPISRTAVACDETTGAGCAKPDVNTRVTDNATCNLQTGEGCDEDCDPSGDIPCMTGEANSQQTGSDELDADGTSDTNGEPDDVDWTDAGQPDENGEQTEYPGQPESTDETEYPDQTYDGDQTDYGDQPDDSDQTDYGDQNGETYDESDYGSSS